MIFSLFSVSASDMDQNKNAEIEYSLDKDDFTIDNKGIIYSNKRLDADINNTYVLTVRATDRGDPPLTGTATVRIYTENKNDEPPKFSQDVYTPNVDENAGPNTLVTTVVASDKDGDNIYFGFVGGGTVSGMFQIEERTGEYKIIYEPKITFFTGIYATLNKNYNFKNISNTLLFLNFFVYFYNSHTIKTILLLYLRYVQH